MLGKTLLACCGLGCATVVSVGSYVGYSTWNGNEPMRDFHRWTHEVGICAGEHAAPAGGGSDDGEAHEHAAGLTCHQPEVATTTSEHSGAREAVIRYVADRVVAAQGIPEITGEEIAAATGVDLSTAGDLSREALQLEVYQELVRRGVDVDALFGETTCSRLAACSVQASLLGASGEELARYERERELDGTRYEQWAAPDFEMSLLDGTRTSVSAHRGKPVLLAFLAGHCVHSLESLPILERIGKDHGPGAIAVLPVYVNSGSTADVEGWISHMNLDLTVGVSESPDPAAAYDAFLVPSMFLIDASGRVVQRLVGFQEESVLRARVEPFLAGNGALVQ